ncbi:hypothetical protein V8J88_16580 [Massilia sp. W12]|uniref:hypothetical protein n=1 Tax=Massilia sp. W12 TaxID=3126507 RepID=UPI0030D284A7
MSEPATNSTTLYSKKDGKQLWSVPVWSPWLYLSHDGRTVVTAYQGMNLVPTDSRMHMEVLRFYRDGKLLRTVRLADLYRRRADMMRTVSHYAWVNTINVTPADLLQIELVSGNYKRFAMATGKEVAQ